ncbi:hypothetical protein KSP35_20575 [Aquihabitans sp. G128]|uniref:hypothetical protein n=1 Tax=Aquihabitans sp. G128 TaxID=2849779 RepID=UPI001C220364|nr:hypothetical protein [Aquihabitans sp. G128]QXC63626.1 hypothetical protein KSP35_20575 [Aquihabitans sp. G128]
MAPVSNAGLDRSMAWVAGGGKASVGVGGLASRVRASNGSTVLAEPEIEPDPEVLDLGTMLAPVYSIVLEAKLMPPPTTVVGRPATTSSMAEVAALDELETMVFTSVVREA